MGTLRLTYGLNEGKLVHIKDVASGDACRCVCPGCGGRLRAKKGEVISHHFAHVETECAHAIESALHLVAKEVLNEAGELWLPSLTLRVLKDDLRVNDEFGSIYQEASLFDAQVVGLSNIRLEQRLGDITPDLIAYCLGTELMIEIAVTHFVDEDKLAKLQQLGTATVEIDLSAMERMPDRAELKDLLTQQNSVIRWLFSPKLQHAKEIEAQRQAERERIIQSEIDQAKAKARYKVNALLSELRGMMQPEAIQARRAAWLNSEAGQNRLKGLARLVGCDPDKFPSPLNYPVSGEDAFDCDRRVWQAAFYFAFFIKNDGFQKDNSFYISQALKWIRNAVPEANVPYCISHIGYLARNMGPGLKPELELSEADRDLLPNPYKAIESYLLHLCELGLLKQIGHTEFIRTGKLIDGMGNSSRSFRPDESRIHPRNTPTQDQQ